MSDDIFYGGDGDADILTYAAAEAGITIQLDTGEQLKVNAAGAVFGNDMVKNIRNRYSCLLLLWLCKVQTM